jgi:RNA polymerase sigma-70 factor, ECF subfamily
LARSFAAPDDRDDLYQEILLQIWRSLDGFAGRSTAGTWLYRIGLNTAVSYRRKMRIRAHHVAGDGEIDPERSGRVSGGRDELQILKEFIETLSEVDRSLFALYLEDLSYAEMADVTGLTENHVGVRISMIKRRFIATYIEGS